jgi:hypothetical protein
LQQGHLSIVHEVQKKQEFFVLHALEEYQRVGVGIALQDVLEEPRTCSKGQLVGRSLISIAGDEGDVEELFFFTELLEVSNN